MSLSAVVDVATAFSGLAATLYVLICGLVAQRFTRALRKRPMLHVQHPALAGMAVQFAARDGRARIHGWHLPARQPRGAVVFVHGKDSCRGDELKAPTFALAQQLNAAGLSVLMIDLRGHGESSAARLSYSENERHDVLGAVDYLQSLGHAAGTIGVLGASMGAAVAMRAAAMEPAIGAVIADTPFADVGFMLRTHFRRLTGLPLCFLPGALLIGRGLLGIDVASVRPVLDARRLRGRPVLVIHSVCDSFIGLSQGVAMAEAARAELWLTQAPRHIGSYAAQPQAYADVVTGFFCRHLPRPALASADAANDSPAVFRPRLAPSAAGVTG